MMNAGADEGGGAGGSAKTLTMRVFVSFTGAGTLDNVQISVAAPAPVRCQQDSFVVPALDGGADTPVIIPITLSTPRGGGCIPANHTVCIMAGYTTRSGPLNKPQTLKSKPYTLNPQPSTLNPIS
jgi:hypothetical protein